MSKTGKKAARKRARQAERAHAARMVDQGVRDRLSADHPSTPVVIASREFRRVTEVGAYHARLDEFGARDTRAVIRPEDRGIPTVPGEYMVRRDPNAEGQGQAVDRSSVAGWTASGRLTPRLLNIGHKGKPYQPAEIGQTRKARPDGPGAWQAAIGHDHVRTSEWRRTKHGAITGGLVAYQQTRRFARDADTAFTDQSRAAAAESELWAHMELVPDQSVLTARQVVAVDHVIDAELSKVRQWAKSSLSISGPTDEPVADAMPDQDREVIRDRWFAPLAAVEHARPPGQGPNRSKSSPEPTHENLRYRRAIRQDPENPGIVTRLKIPEKK